MLSLPPLMSTKELRVVGSADTDDLTPASGKRLSIYSFQASMIVPSALTSTLRASLSFGTGHVTDTSKVLASFRTIPKDSLGCVCMNGIYCTGGIDEVIRLTNSTYSAGECITRAVVYYSQK